MGCIWQLSSLIHKKKKKICCQQNLFTKDFLKKSVKHHLRWDMASELLVSEWLRAAHFCCTGRTVFPPPFRMAAESVPNLCSEQCVPWAEPSVALLVQPCLYWLSHHTNPVHVYHNPLHRETIHWFLTLVKENKLHSPLCCWNLHYRLFLASTQLQCVLPVWICLADNDG